MRITKKKIIYSVLLIIVIWVGYTIYSAQAAPKKVSTIKFQKEKLEQLVTASGKIQPVQTRSLAFNTSGRLLSLPFEEGDMVKKGTLLGYIDLADAKEQSNKAWADYRNMLEKVREFDNNNKDKPKTDTLNISRSQLEAQRDSFASLVAQSLLAQNKGVLVSPIDGTITQINNKQGEVITAGATVVIISDLTELEFVAEIDEQDIGKVIASQSARLNIDAYPENIVYGYVQDIGKSAKINSSGGTYYPTKVAVPRAEVTLRSGMNGDADIVLSEADDIPSIPRDVLIEEDSKQYVFIIENGVARKREVVLGRQGDTYVEVTSGISSQDSIISSDLSTLVENSKVIAK